MKYKIIDKGFYFPRTEQWIMDTFNISVFEAMVYQMILNKGYMTWTPEWLASVCRCSRSTIVRTLDKLINLEVLTKRTFNTSDGGVRLRTVYVALYDSNGKRDNNLVQSLLEAGYEKIALDYAEKRYYKRK